MKTLSQEEEYRINCFTTKSNYGKGERVKTLSFVSAYKHTQSTDVVTGAKSVICPGIREQRVRNPHVHLSGAESSCLRRSMLDGATGESRAPLSSLHAYLGPRDCDFRDSLVPGLREWEGQCAQL